MVKEELIKYIKEVKKQGHKDEAIIVHLKNHGYPEEIIDEAFEKLNKKFDILFVIMLLLISIGIFLILGIVFIGLKENIFSSKPNPLCEDVSVEVYEFQDKGIICHELDKNINIQIPLENSGEKKIDELEFMIIGDNNIIKDSKPNLDLLSGDIFPKVINYDKNNGKLNKISIVPKIKENDRLIQCKQKSLEITSFNCD
ncbi:hypothetical protein GF327_00490 [Candidatus Woesearchaeota archaeon]|nr:hypothetical protein [Candidatus Woesearchaeota archaeon]